MPYLRETLTGQSAREAAEESAPFGPGFHPDKLEKIQTLEIWCSNVTDPGEDYTEFRALDGRGGLVGTKKVKGY